MANTCIEVIFSCIYHFEIKVQKHDKLADRTFWFDNSHDQPPYHLVGSVVDYHEIDGYGELGFDSGEIDLNRTVALTGISRRAKYPFSKAGGRDNK